MASDDIHPPALSAKLSELRLGSKFTPELFAEVLENISNNHNTIKSIELAGISSRHFYRKLQEHPDLIPQFEAAQLQRDKIRNAERVEAAETELARRGVEGWVEPVFDIKGNHCGDKPRYSDACLIFMLKKLKPEVYADSPAALIQNNINTKKDSAELMSEWRDMLGAKPAVDVETIQE